MYDLAGSGTISTVVLSTGTTPSSATAWRWTRTAISTSPCTTPIRKSEGLRRGARPEGRVIENNNRAGTVVPTNLGFGRGTDDNSLYLTNLVNGALADSNGPAEDCTGIEALPR